jgi:hypothetical protein
VAIEGGPGVTFLQARLHLDHRPQAAAVPHGAGGDRQGFGAGLPAQPDPGEHPRHREPAASDPA